MPVSGGKEPGIIARQSSESSAGVPIKKRRFHLVRPPSPVPQTCSPILEPGLQQNEQSISKSESTLKAASAPAPGNVVSNPTDHNREHCESRNVNSVKSNIEPPPLKIQEPRFPVASFSGSKTGGIGKCKVDDKNSLQTVAENIELCLAPNEALVLKPECIKSETVLMNNDPVEKQVNTELFLASNDHTAPDLGGNGGEYRKEEEKLDPQLWNLGLHKGKTCSESTADHNKSKINMCPNRSNWDLNTEMERWDNSATIHAIGVVHGSNLADSHDVKPVMCSSGSVVSELQGTLVDHGNQVVVKHGHATESISLCPPREHHKTEDLLHLSLNTASVVQSSCQMPLSLSSKLDLGNKPSDLNLTEKADAQSNNEHFVGSRPLKLELSDDDNQRSLKKNNDNHAKATCGMVKSEPFEESIQESSRSSSKSSLEPVSHASVKSEPICGFNQETLVTSVLNSQKPELSYECMGNVRIRGNVPCLDGLLCPTFIRTTSGSPQLPTRVEVSSDAEATRESALPSYTESMTFSKDILKQVVTERINAIPSDLASKSSDPENKFEVDKAVKNIPQTEGFGVVDSESSRLTLMANPCLDSYGNGEVAESDEGKISLSDDMQDDCSLASDMETDGDNAVGGTNSKDKHDNGEDDDYEDGEVREPLVQSSSKDGPCEDKALEHANHGNEDDKELHVSGSGDGTTTTQVECQDAKMENPGETVVSLSPGGGECDNVIASDKPDQLGSSAPCSAETLANELPPASTGKRKINRSALRKPQDCAGKEATLQGCNMEMPSDGVGNANQGAKEEKNDGGSASKQENAEETNQQGVKSTILSKMETCASSSELSKDVNNGVKQSRIINLARLNGSSSLSSGRTRSVPGVILSSRTERERLINDSVDGDKLLLRGSRHDKSIEGGRKFERQRNEDQPAGSTGSGFMHGRGRSDKHLDSSCDDWESDRNFGLDDFSGPTSFRFSGPKNASGGSSAKIECNGLLVARDAIILRGGRGGRKSLNDELSSFRHPPRRRSPTGREGPASHGVQMVRRPARDTSPDRCVSAGGPDLIALRHEEKFMRGPPDEMMDPMFSHPQPQYQRVGGPFVRGDRSFSPIQRRGPLHVNRMRSKSPPGSSRARSPGQWSSPRRRSPDAFERHELIHRRTSPFYRMDRMRSPHQNPCFPEDMVARRHGSPPYVTQLTNNMREMGPPREHDHPRFITNRSPSGRGLPRSTRRFEIIDPREEIEREDYFGGHMPSGRFHELGGDGITDGRRILERREVARPFRPPFSGSDVDNFPFYEGGPRPYRISPEADAEFHDRGSLRVREFERRVKNRPGNVPRRTRSIEEQEESYRHREQGWHEPSFEGVPRLKRRRF